MHPISVTTVTPGVARLDWGSVAPEVAELRLLVEEVLAEYHRVEVHLRLDDALGQRLALWAGLHREGVARGVPFAGGTADVVVHARVADDAPVGDPTGFRSMLNSFLPRKRAIGQLLIRDLDQRVLLCQLTYKQDWDLPGGVVEVGENPRTGVLREVQEELALELRTDRLLLTDWMPTWGGWDDALCLVFDGGVHPESILDRVVRQEKEIASVAFLTLEQVRERATDFTARRVETALLAVHEGAQFSESGRRV